MLLSHIQKYVLDLRIKTVLQIPNPFLYQVIRRPGVFFVRQFVSGHIYALDNKWKYLRYKNIANDMILGCVHDDQAILFLCRSNYVAWVCTIVIHLHNARTVMFSVQMDDRFNSCNKRYKSWTTECFYRLYSFWRFFSVEH